MISASKWPDRVAAAHRCWLRKAKSSWSDRETPHSAATFSAVSAIESTPKRSRITGLTKRHPSTTVLKTNILM